MQVSSNRKRKNEVNRKRNIMKTIKYEIKLETFVKINLYSQDRKNAHMFKSYLETIDSKIQNN